jgi:hypothetical protein
VTVYAFHPCGADGKTQGVEYADLADDAEAYVHAADVICEHPECADVVVCRGERRVFSRSWLHPELEGVLSRKFSS